MNTFSQDLTIFLDTLFRVKRPTTKLITTSVPTASNNNPPQSPVQTSQTKTPNAPVTNTNAKPPIAQATPQNPTVVQVTQVARTLAEIRQTSAFIQNAPKLFDSSSSALLSAEAAVSILQAAGIPVPKDIKLSVAACQVIASGGAVSSAVSSGASFGSIAAPSASMIDAIAHLGKAAGFLEVNNEQMMTIDVATDSIMVIAAGGANVLADLKFVLDVYQLGSSMQGSLQSGVNQTAQQLLNAEVQQVLQQQQATLTDNFKNLANGSMDMFTFAEKTAAGSATLFSKVFPQLGVFFPPDAIETFTAWATARNWLGQTASSNLSQDVVTDVSGGQDFFFTEWASLFLDPLIEPYNRVLGNDLQTTDAQGNKISKRISLDTLAIMSLLPNGLQNLDPNLDIRPYLTNWGLTPGDFPWDDCITSELNDPNSQWFAHPIEASLPAPMSLNGVDTINPNSTFSSELNDLRYQFRQTAFDANSAGDIKTLLSDPKCSELINQWGKIRDFGPSDFKAIMDPATGAHVIGYTRISTGVVTALPLPDMDGTVLTSQIRLRNKLMNGNWRDIKNYIGVLSVLNYMLSKNIYNPDFGGYNLKAPNIKFGTQFQQKYPQINFDIDTLSYAYSQVVQKTTYRRLNNLALQNIASLLGTTLDKLLFVNKNGLLPDQAGLFKVKG